MKGHGVNGMSDTDLEQRSGLKGFGRRPKLHPSWGERLDPVPKIDALSDDGRRRDVLSSEGANQGKKKRKLTP